MPLSSPKQFGFLVGRDVALPHLTRGKSGAWEVLKERVDFTVCLPFLPPTKDAHP